MRKLLVFCLLVVWAALTLGSRICTRVPGSCVFRNQRMECSYVCGDGAVLTEEQFEAERFPTQNRLIDEREDAEVFSYYMDEPVATGPLYIGRGLGEMIVHIFSMFDSLTLQLTLRMVGLVVVILVDLAAPQSPIVLQVMLIMAVTLFNFIREPVLSVCAMTLADFMMLFNIYLIAGKISSAKRERFVYLPMLLQMVTLPWIIRWFVDSHYPIQWFVTAIVIYVVSLLVYYMSVITLINDQSARLLSLSLMFVAAFVYLAATVYAAPKGTIMSVRGSSVKMILDVVSMGRLNVTDGFSSVLKDTTRACALYYANNVTAAEFTHLLRGCEPYGYLGVLFGVLVHILTFLVIVFLHLIAYVGVIAKGKYRQPLTVGKLFETLPSVIANDLFLLVLSPVYSLSIGTLMLSGLYVLAFLNPVIYGSALLILVIAIKTNVQLDASHVRYEARLMDLGWLEDDHPTVKEWTLNTGSMFAENLGSNMSAFVPPYLRTSDGSTGKVGYEAVSHEANIRPGNNDNVVLPDDLQWIRDVRFPMLRFVKDAKTWFGYAIPLVQSKILSCAHLIAEGYEVLIGGTVVGTVGKCQDLGTGSEYAAINDNIRIADVTCNFQSFVFNRHLSPLPSGANLQRIIVYDLKDNTAHKPTVVNIVGGGKILEHNANVSTSGSLILYGSGIVGIHIGWRENASKEKVNLALLLSHSIIDRKKSFISQNPGTGVGPVTSTAVSGESSAGGTSIS